MADSRICPTCNSANTTFLKKRGLWLCGDCEHEFAPDQGPTAQPDLSSLPSIIALPVQDYLRETNPVLKLWHACDVVELALRLTVTLGVADLARRGPLPEGLLKELQPRIEEPTLGKWRGMAQAVVKELDPVLGAFPEAGGFVDDLVVPLLDGPRKPRTPETSLSELRNRLAHGGGVTRAAARRLLTVWMPRLEEAFARLDWMSSFHLVVRGREGALVALRGPSALGVPYAAPVGVAASVAAALTHGEDVLAVRNDAVLTLWPLAAFGRPRGADPESATSGESPQVFSRRGEVRVHYTPIGSEESCHAEGMESALDAFLQLFQLTAADRRKIAARFEVPGFEHVIRKDADLLVGRSAELALVREALSAWSDGALWLPGPAGIGKSYLMARIAAELLEEPPAGTLVLPYRFKSGDPRCARGAFVTFVLERLKAWEAPAQPGPLEGEEEGDDAGRGGGKPKPKKPIEELRERLGALGERRVILILDGLDEVVERDPAFAREVPLALRLPGVCWLCAGRPERGLPEAFAQAGARTLFPEGLPGMRVNDVRTMIIERIGRYRLQLIGRDRDEGEKVINSFIEKVARNADGLPLYVTYVVGDVLGNRVSAGDAGARLPASLEKYHEELLSRCAVGVLHQVVTPLVATIAVAREPLAPEALADILVARTLIDPNRDDPGALVRRALAAIASMLRRSVTPDGEEGYSLYHHSLRQHMEGSPEMAGPLATARTALATQAEALGGRTGAASRYLFRHGIAHLVESKDAARALVLLCRFDYLMARLRALPEAGAVQALLEDWPRVRAAGVRFERPARICESFFRENGHILRRGNEEWPAYKILLQLAIEHADESPLTLGAEEWLGAGRCDWVWMRRLNRFKAVDTLVCLATFEGHSAYINGAHELPDGRILSWSWDGTLRLWNGESGAPLATLSGHLQPVEGALPLTDGRILSWSWDKSLRLWDGLTGAALAVFEGHGLEIKGVQVLPDGRILSWSDEINLRLWDSHTGAVSGLLEGHSGRVNGAQLLPDGRILSWSDDATLRLWNGQTGAPISVLKGHSSKINGALVLADGRILSWSGDATLRIWDGQAGAHSVPLKGHRRAISYALVTPQGIILSWSDDGSLRLWDGNTGAPLSLLKGHLGRVVGAQVLPDGSVLSWSSDDTLKLWFAELGMELMEFSGHSLAVVGANAFADGRILSWSHDGTLRVWDGTKDDDRRSLVLGPNSAVEGALVLPDGKIASWHWREHGILRIWDSASGRLLRVIGEKGFDNEMPNEAYAICKERYGAKANGLFVLDANKNSIDLRALFAGMAPLAMWHGISFVSARFLSSDGSMVATDWKDEAVLLHLYFGNQRTDLEGLRSKLSLSLP